MAQPCRSDKWVGAWSVRRRTRAGMRSRVSIRRCTRRPAQGGAACAPCRPGCRSAPSIMPFMARSSCSMACCSRSTRTWANAGGFIGVAVLQADVRLTRCRDRVTWVGGRNRRRLHVGRPAARHEARPGGRMDRLRRPPGLIAWEAWPDGAGCMPPAIECVMPAWGMAHGAAVRQHRRLCLPWGRMAAWAPA